MRKVMIVPGDFRKASPLPLNPIRSNSVFNEKNENRSIFTPPPII
jgi:hypothetical protein